MARAAEIRQNCLRLVNFIEAAWHVLEPNTPYVPGWHIEAIAEHLEAITRGEIKRLAINIPPGMMKSLLASVFWPAWEWTLFPGLRFLTTSYQEGYARRDARKMRDLVQSEWYQTLWPIELVRDNEVDFENTATGFRKAMPFRSLTGGRGNRVIVDDPHSTTTVESDTERNEATRLFRESVPSRLDNQQQDAVLVIMHRLHPKDVCGIIDDYKIDYTKLILPMEFEPDRIYPTRWFQDPRRRAGELLCPARVSAETIAKFKAGEMTSHAYAGQYQQRPSSREGGMFKRHWFQIVDAVPSEVKKRVRRWDFAGTEAKDNTDPDWTAGVRMAAGDGKFYVEDVCRFRERGAKVRQTIKSIASQDDRDCDIVIPQDPGQAGKDQAASIIGENPGYRIYAERETGSKETRAEPLAAQAEAGNVYLLRGPWNEAFIDELCAFPLGHDDQFDAAAGAFNHLASEPSPMKISKAVLDRARAMKVRR